MEQVLSLYNNKKDKDLATKHFAIALELQNPDQKNSPYMAALYADQALLLATEAIEKNKEIKSILYFFYICN